MTKITFYKWDNTFYGFKETGHTGWDEAGKDVLCAALSAMTMLIINTIEVSYASDVKYTIDEATTDHISCRSRRAEGFRGGRAQALRHLGTYRSLLLPAQ